LWMRRVGRRNGFLTGIAFGLVGAVAGAGAIAAASLVMLCFAHMLLGLYNAFGQYYRFAAADSAAPDFRATAISLVLAGGLVGGLVGPELSKHTIDFATPTYFATYLSLLVYGVAAALVVSRLKIPASVEAGSHDPARPLAEVARQPRFVVAVL